MRNIAGTFPYLPSPNQSMQRTRRTMDSLDQIVAQFMKPNGPNHRPLQGPITLGAVNKDGKSGNSVQKLSMTITLD